jgi:hypothetical protein
VERTCDFIMSACEGPKMRLRDFFGTRGSTAKPGLNAQGTTQRTDELNERLSRRAEARQRADELNEALLFRRAGVKPPAEQTGGNSPRSNHAKPSSINELRDGQEYDLIFLCNAKIVTISGLGHSLQRISLKITNLCERRLIVVIALGTYFVSTGNYQSMAARDVQRVTLAAHQTTQTWIDVVCINATLPIPTERDLFTNIRMVDETLRRFLHAAQREHPMTIQAGVWAITDRMSRKQIRTRVAAISETSTNRAWVILRQNNINTSDTKFVIILIVGITAALISLLFIILADTNPATSAELWGHLLLLLILVAGFFTSAFSGLALIAQK